MRSSTVIMIVFAVLFGLIAVFLAQSWLNSQAEMRARNMQTTHKPVVAQTIVVAAKPLRYGHQLTQESLREIPWPEGVLPQGAFASVPDVLKDGKRIVLTAIEPNEPLLTVKITGPGQRATLSSLVQDGFKAVTIRVNDVDGVGGFVLPGDRVDVALTRNVDKENASTQVILQDVRVLAIDQVADERTSNPSVAKSVTLEVDTVGAQKLSLAGSIGSLSLMLRKAGEASAEKSSRVTVKDLFQEIIPDRGRSSAVTVTVRRGSQQESYNVPVEGTRRSAAVSDGGPARR
ncbi:MAG: Flp pilus assembly protein CpaB [Hyphomicrobiales bacterium]|nr:Flp pilus assembly protein CpaB [Hyphomicrobiales bacterium]